MRSRGGRGRRGRVGGIRGRREVVAGGEGRRDRGDRRVARAGRVAVRARGAAVPASGCAASRDDQQSVGAEGDDHEAGAEVEQRSGALDRVVEAGRLGELLAIRLQDVGAGAAAARMPGPLVSTTTGTPADTRRADERAELVGAEPRRQAPADRDRLRRATEVGRGVGECGRLGRRERRADLVEHRCLAVAVVDDRERCGGWVRDGRDESMGTPDAARSARSSSPVTPPAVAIASTVMPGRVQHSGDVQPLAARAGRSGRHPMGGARGRAGRRARSGRAPGSGVTVRIMRPALSRAMSAAPSSPASPPSSAGTSSGRRWKLSRSFTRDASGANERVTGSGQARRRSRSPRERPSRPAAPRRTQGRRARTPRPRARRRRRPRHGRARRGRRRPPSPVRSV